MEHDPQVPPYLTSDKNSFASVSAEDRWPKIITSGIDDVHRTTADATDETVRQEGRAIVEALAKLKYELQHNRQMTPIADDGESDIEGYNEELKQRGTPLWHDCSWLYSECYLYRRINTLFTLSEKWKSYDIFSRQKLSTFKSSRAAAIELAARYKDLRAQLQDEKRRSSPADEALEAERVLFNEMCEICLWGNATDLSLLTNLTYEDIQKLQGAKARKAAEGNIVVNNLPEAFRSLKKTQKQKPNDERRVDIVLDNAGFELFVDLILAGYFILSGLATTIVLHPKSIPWFVSDVIPQDFAALLEALRDPVAFYSSLAAEDEKAGQKTEAALPLAEGEVANLKALFEHWSQLHEDGKMVIRPNRFWTHAGSYWRMPQTASSLYADLRKSDMVILKGDLNSRKLAGDVMWPTTTPYPEALGPLARPGSGLRILQLRTCKADTVVGLPPGEDERLKSTDGGGGDSGARKWAWTGKWAVVQYNDAL